MLQGAGPGMSTRSLHVGSVDCPVPHCADANCSVANLSRSKVGPSSPVTLAADIVIMHPAPSAQRPIGPGTPVQQQTTARPQTQHSAQTPVLDCVVKAEADHQAGWDAGCGVCRKNDVLPAYHYSAVITWCKKYSVECLPSLQVHDLDQICHHMPIDVTQKQSLRHLAPVLLGDRRPAGR